jgi:hypothetical protein
MEAHSSVERGFFENDGGVRTLKCCLLSLFAVDWKKQWENQSSSAGGMMFWDQNLKI